MSFQIKNTFLKVIICLTLYSCITPVDLKKETTENALIVEGGISTAKESHIIRLSKVAPYGGVYAGTPSPVTNALVLIKDSDGKSVQAVHDSVGIYKTPRIFHAEVGKKYSLIIHLDNKTYVSSDELVEPLSELENVYFVYNEYPELNSANSLSYKNGFDIRARYKKSENTSDYNYWDYEGTYLSYTYPEQHVIYKPGDPIPKPAPKPCCAACFRKEINNQLKISSFDLGTTINDEKLFFIEDNAIRFYQQYSILIKRYSLTRTAYQFYKEVTQQLKIHGDIFDPPPVTIRGNIYNIDNLDELVVGYFRASDISYDTLRIYNTDLKSHKPLPVIKDDCRVLPNSSIEPPGYY